MAQARRLQDGRTAAGAAATMQGPGGQRLGMGG